VILLTVKGIVAMEYQQELTRRWDTANVNVFTTISHT